MNSKKSQNTSTSRTLLTQIIIVAVIAGGILLFERLFNNGSSLVNEGSMDESSVDEAVLFIDFDNMQRTFRGEVVERMTILDALNASVTAGKIEFRYFVDGSNNTKITEINDHFAEENDQFTFYINSEKIDTSNLNRIYIQPGDEIIIRLE